MDFRITSKGQNVVLSSLEAVNTVCTALDVAMTRVVQVVLGQRLITGARTAPGEGRRESQRSTEKERVRKSCSLSGTDF